MRLTIILLFTSMLVHTQEVSHLSIYFNTDSYEVVPNERVKLDSLVKHHDRDSIRLVLKGYTDQFAGNDYNLKLAQRRVTATKEFLKAFTIDTLQAIGELQDASWRARRVDISVVIKEKNIPDSSNFIVDEPKNEGNKRRMLSSRNLDITSYSELEINETTVLFGVFFQGGTDKMLGSISVITLRKVVRFLKGYPTRKILITGHICCSPDREPKLDGYNNRTRSMTLSEDRGKIVYDYLIKNGISADRLKYRGKAYTEPLDWEETKNRRVEMTILE